MSYNATPYYGLETFPKIVSTCFSSQSWAGYLAETRQIIGSSPLLMMDEFMKSFRLIKDDYEAFYSGIDRLRAELLTSRP